MIMYSIEKCELERILPLRSKFLYAHKKTVENSKFIIDKADSVHFVAVIDGEDVGCASINKDNKLVLGKTVEYRLGGLAVDEKYRHLGIGRDLVIVRLEYLQDKGQLFAWASARVHKVSMYVKLGALVDANIYQTPLTGAHCDILYDLKKRHYPTPPSVMVQP